MRVRLYRREIGRVLLSVGFDPACFEKHRCRCVSVPAERSIGGEFGVFRRKLCSKCTVRELQGFDGGLASFIDNTLKGASSLLPLASRGRQTQRSSKEWRC